MRCTLLILLVAVGCSSTTVKPPVTSPVPTSKSPQEAVVYLVNKERERARLSALGTLRTLDKAAQDYSQQMESAGQLSHNLGGGFQATGQFVERHVHCGRREHRRRVQHA
jgi:uncharacterized protein YkwD